MPDRLEPSSPTNAVDMLNKDGNAIIAITTDSKLGFFNTSPIVIPNIPAVSVPQDIVDALVALGLVTNT